jgi:uncharacterized protein YegP (UPF0339 family)
MLPLPRFEIRRNKITRRYRFRLVARNGEVTAPSQSYATKAGAEKGIASIKADAAEAAVIDLT